MKPALIFTCVLFGCTEYELSEAKEAEVGSYPIIDVSPAALTFTEATVGNPEEDLFTITNVGDADLNISQLQLLGSQTYSYTQMGNPILSPGQSADVFVVYAPISEGSSDSASILVSSNDPDTPMVEVPLSAVIETTGMPILRVDPSNLDLGTINVGSVTTGTFLLESVGDVPVDLMSYSMSGSSFTLNPVDTWPLTLAPGETTSVDVTFAPTTGGSVSETFTVDCADPAGDPIATVTAAVDDSLPIADCYVDPAQIQPNTGATATWHGSNSYDPNGAALINFNWTLISKPAGSQVFMPFGSSANRGGFAPDLAGDYIAQLVVTNEFGVSSEPCEATLEAIPGQGLWVQMSWTYSNDDMDLHLLYNNGSYNSNNDCYYANCPGGGPDWGQSGNTADNPSLDQDDIGGIGPENTTIQTPYSGTYTVVVHDYPGSTFTGGNAVTVVIFLGGVQVWSDTRTISGEDTYTHFAEISYPSMTVTPL